jgi:arylsulfatase A-like enzyme
VEALLEYAIPEVKPDMAIVWFSDPDHTAHEHGMGDPVTVDSLKAVDAEVGRILDGVGGGVNVIIGSDHGFSTNVGEGKLPELLAGAGFKDVVIVDGAIYVRKGGAVRVPEIVALLQKTPWIGAIFTKPIDGAPIEGTLPLSAARWDHPRSADILVAPQWTDDANAHGFKGTTALPGVATHGNSSTWDIHNIGFAAGPAFKKAAVVTTASGNVDWAPTMLHVMGIEAPEQMDGRVLAEALLDAPADAAPEKTETDRAEYGTYEVQAQWTVMGRARYLDFVKGTRAE